MKRRPLLIHIFPTLKDLEKAGLALFSRQRTKLLEKRSPSNLSLEKAMADEERHEELFRKEYALICSMNHENIIKVFDLMEFKNFLLMPMEIGKFSLM